MTASGFPHSDIHGSTLAYSSPWHFGVRPVLRRLLAPRHPPCALPTFTCFNGYPFMSVNSVGVLRYLVSKVHIDCLSASHCCVTSARSSVTYNCVRAHPRSLRSLHCSHLASLERTSTLSGWFPQN